MVQLGCQFHWAWDRLRDTPLEGPGRFSSGRINFLRRPSPEPAAPSHSGPDVKRPEGRIELPLPACWEVTSTLSLPPVLLICESRLLGLPTWTKDRWLASHLPRL